MAAPLNFHRITGRARPLDHRFPHRLEPLPRLQPIGVKVDRLPTKLLHAEIRAGRQTDHFATLLQKPDEGHKQLAVQAILV